MGSVTPSANKTGSYKKGTLKNGNLSKKNPIKTEHYKGETL